MFTPGDVIYLERFELAFKTLHENHMLFIKNSNFKKLLCPNEKKCMSGIKF